jgi:hypothetical protein
MNFRTTTLLFGLLLGVLWVFGLMLAIRKSALDEGYVLPRLAQLPKDAINYVEIKKGDKSYIFIKDKDKGWRLREPPSEQEVRAEPRKVEDLVDEVRLARHSNAEAGELTRNLAQWGLTNPKITVTLRDTTGRAGVEGQFFIGDESGDRAFVYCNSSERKRDVLAVKRSSIASVFITDIDDFRVRRLLEGTDQTTKKIVLTENKDNKVRTLALEKVGENAWKFIDPKFGPAEFGGGGGLLAKDKDKEKDKGKSDQSVFSLINAVTSLRAEKFEPIGSTMHIDEKKALLRIELDVGEAGGKFAKKDKDKGKVTTEVLLIGDMVRKAKADDPAQYYAQLKGDNSVVIVDAKTLEPVFAAINDPKALRSRDVAQFDAFDVDAIDLFKDAKDFVKLYRKDKQWLVFSPDDLPRKANNPTVDGPTGLLSAIQGKHAIPPDGFVDTDTEQKLKDVEAKFAKDKIVATVSVWSDSLEPEKEPKKDDKKDTKKDEGKDAKKDDKKEEIKRPEMKKDAKPLVTLSFVNLASDKMLVKREAKDTDPVYFELAKTDYEKIVPPEMALTFFDTSLTTFNSFDATKLELIRRQDKDVEKFVLSKETKKEEPKKDEAKKDEKKDTGKETNKDAGTGKDTKKDTGTGTKDTKTDSAKTAKDTGKGTATTTKDTQKDTASATKDTKKDTATTAKDTKKDTASATKDSKKDSATTAKDTQKDTASATRDAKKETAKEDTKKDTGTKKDSDKKEEKKEPEVTFWKLIEPKDWGGKTEAEAPAVENVLSQLALVKAERWVGNAKKRPLAELGLDYPTVTAIVTYKVKEGDKDTTKTFTLKLGNKSRRESDAGGYYALMDGSDYIFVVKGSLEKVLMDAEFRDRQVLKFDPAKVKELQAYILDSTGKVQFKPNFKRDKDKGWIATGLDVVNPDLGAVDRLLKSLSDLQAVRFLNVKPPLPKECKLDDKVPLKFELTMDDGKKYWVTVGAESEKGGPYYAQCSEMPTVVFLAPRATFAPVMEGLPYFSKE